METTPLILTEYSNNNSDNNKIQQQLESNDNNPTLSFVKICGTSFLFSLFLAVYILLIIISAATFSYLETPSELALRANVANKIQEFLNNHPGVSEHELQQLIRETVTANRLRISTSQSITSEEVISWSIEQSIFFSVTVATTIGYGQVAPITNAGKLFCMVYALIALPMTLVLISALVERLKTPTIYTLHWMHTHLHRQCRRLTIQILHLASLVSLLVVVLLLIPAVIFTQLEPEWSYLDAIYYCFISLTTIGLGDYTPANGPHQEYRFLYQLGTVCYLFVGLTCVMLTLSLYNDIPELNVGGILSEAVASEQQTPIEKTATNNLQFTKDRKLCTDYCPL